MGALGVVDVVEHIDLGLKLGRRVGQRLLVQISEQRLVETFVLSLSGRLVGLAGDCFDPECVDMVDKSAAIALAGRVESSAIVGQESLRNPVRCNCLVEDCNCGFRGLTTSHVGGNGETRMVVK